jgi:hypothetical protein
MGRAPSHKKVRYGPKTSYNQAVCEQQFPECPTAPNQNDCHTCPLWGTGISKPYKEKEVGKETEEQADSL